MTNALPQGSPGAPSASHSAGPIPGSSLMPRRSSYASVVSGTASAPPQSYNPPARSGAFSHLMNPSPTPGYPQQTQSDQHSRRSSRGVDIDTYATGVRSAPGSWGRDRQLPSYSSQFGSFITGYGVSGVSRSPPTYFFTPSYLKNSKYIEKLAEAHKIKFAAQKDGLSTSNPGSLSNSSSSVNLHKMTPSHRGMTYDIIEKELPIEDDGLGSLPSQWNEDDKFQGLDIQGDGLEVRFTGPGKPHEHEAAAVRADHPMSPQCGIYYYEVTVISKGKEGYVVSSSDETTMILMDDESLIGVGFSGPKVALSRLPGWEPESWAYHGDDGYSFCCQSSGKKYGPQFSTADVIGCGVNFRTGCAFFTKNGVNIGIAFRDLKGAKLYPSVGMKKPGEHLRVNFGQTPFVFDIDGMMATEKMTIDDEINAAVTATLHPPLDETALIQELVAQFLAHDGYVETARAFASEIREESRALEEGHETKGKEVEAEEDLDAINRQRIRAAILVGDVDKALKQTNAYYPNVLKNNEHIYFRLRCRKFIELIRRCADLHSGSSENRANSTNGHENDLYDDVFDNDMELDDQANNSEDWDRMETEEADNSMKYQDLLQETLDYGQELQLEFRDDPRREVKKALEQTFSLLAYTDPRTSVVAHLLESSGRVPVAEELNSAILVSLGKSSSAALERLYQQTEVLIGDISEEGGAGAFIHVRNDFLR
ncbi:MAG: hypothetical protein M1827_006376 [Pycnora praestabilis]|nr:MAG: hypothetical protein M1827_006376 [Pycnora praestabilis]